jgi:hypothetical protein
MIEHNGNVNKSSIGKNLGNSARNEVTAEIDIDKKKINIFDLKSDARILSV